MEPLLELAQKAARESARIAMSYYGLQAFTQKADESPLTEADTHIHAYLSLTLEKTGIPVLSEEGVELDLPYPDRLWIIDPIDGTRGFINKTADFSVMIGLIEQGRPVLGVVHAPATDTLYYATKGGGAWKIADGVTQPLRVSDRSIPKLRALTSINHFEPYMEKVATALEVTSNHPIGGIGTKASLIAEDAGDYFLTLGNLGEWDVCAPEIILAEAGGKVTDRNGDPLIYGNPTSHIQTGVVFSNGVSHREVLAALHLATRPDPTQLG